MVAQAAAVLFAQEVAFHVQPAFAVQVPEVVRPVHVAAVALLEQLAATAAVAEQLVASAAQSASFFAEQ